MSPERYRKLRKQDKETTLHPCPFCHRPEKLPAYRRALGHHCNECDGTGKEVKR